MCFCSRVLKSLQSIGTSLNRTANTVRFVDLEHPFCLQPFFTTRHGDVNFVKKFSLLRQVVPGAHKVGSIQQDFVFVCVKMLEPSIFFKMNQKTRFTYAASS